MLSTPRCLSGTLVGALSTQIGGKPTLETPGNMLSKYSQRGFSLLEVMVALVVLSVGLLGVVKLESVAYSSTNVASKRSLAALQAASLAAAMHVNRGYWNSPDVSNAIITITNGTAAVTASAPLLAAGIAAAPNCRSTALPCVPVNMAAYDLGAVGDGVAGAAAESEFPGHHFMRHVQSRELHDQHSME